LHSLFDIGGGDEEKEEEEKKVRVEKEEDDWEDGRGGWQEKEGEK
jgi:hypothetical protein